MIKERPSELRGWTKRMRTGCGHLYVTLNVDDDGYPFEIFCKLGKAGGCAASQVEALGRLVALALRSGVGVPQIVKQLQGISCHLPVFGEGKVTSCADAIAKVMVKILETKIEEEKREPKIVDLAPGAVSPTPPAPVKTRVVEPEKPKVDADELKKREMAEKIRQDYLAKEAAYKKRKAGQGACPDCGGPIVNEEGCEKCHSCGYTKC